MFAVNIFVYIHLNKTVQGEKNTAILWSGVKNKTNKKTKGR